MLHAPHQALGPTAGVRRAQRTGDPRLTPAGNRLARQLGPQALDQLKHWSHYLGLLLHRGTRPLPAADRPTPWRRTSPRLLRRPTPGREGGGTHPRNFLHEGIDP